jgi:uncharacterized protein
MAVDRALYAGQATLHSSLLGWTPSPEDLIGGVLQMSTNRFSPLHGEDHLRGVAHAGLVVGASTQGADLRIVFLFGLLHDGQRWNEYDDPDHGQRAADLLPGLKRDGLLDLPEAEEWLLVMACRLHSEGSTSSDPTVGSCWDADRLNLWRLGWTPAESLLSTTEAKRPERVIWAREMLRAVPTWNDLLGRWW